MTDNNTRQRETTGVSVAVDVVVVSMQDGVPHVLTVQPPYRNPRVLPGGYLNRGETLHEAARRELFEKTGLEVEALRYVGVFDDPARVLHARVIGHAYVVVLDGMPTPTPGYDAEDVRWLAYPFAHGTELGFDHANIIAAALEQLADPARYSIGTHAGEPALFVADDEDDDAVVAFLDGDTLADAIRYANDHAAGRDPMRPDVSAAQAGPASYRVALNPNGAPVLVRSESPVDRVDHEDPRQVLRFIPGTSLAVLVQEAHDDADPHAINDGFEPPAGLWAFYVVKRSGGAYVLASLDGQADQIGDDAAHRIVKTAVIGASVEHLVRAAHEWAANLNRYWLAGKQDGTYVVVQSDTPVTQVGEDDDRVVATVDGSAGLGDLVSTIQAHVSTGVTTPAVPGELGRYRLGYNLEGFVLLATDEEADEYDVPEDHPSLVQFVSGGTAVAHLVHAARYHAIGGTA